MPKHISPDVKAEIVRLRVEDRLSGPEIRARFDISYDAIYKLIRPYPLTKTEIRQRRERGARRMRDALIAKGGYVGGRDWSSEEDSRLRKLWPTASWRRLVKAFPERSKAAIGRRAANLLLRRHFRTGNKARRVDKFFQSLREVREMRNILRQELADKIGIHVLQLLKYETGQQTPRWLTLRAWLDALHCDIDVVGKDLVSRARKGLSWSKEEDRILHELITQGTPAVEVAQVMRRVPKEIELRAKALGLAESETARNVSGMTRARFGT